MATVETIADGFQESHPTVTLYARSPCTPRAYAYGGTPVGSVPSPSVIEYTPSAKFTVQHPDPALMGKGEKRNWARIRRSGQISMTERDYATVKTERYVVSRPRRFRTWSRHQVTCSSVCQDKSPLTHADYGWTENNVDSTLGHLPHHYENSVDGIKQMGRKIANAIAATQLEANAEALTTTDVLTEIAEARETLSFLALKTGVGAEALAAFRDKDLLYWEKGKRLSARALLRSADRGLRSLGSRWMEHRYVIGPIVYSMYDQADLWTNRNAVFKTGRSRRDESVKVLRDDIFLPETAAVRYTTLQYDAIIRSTLKVKYSVGNLRRLGSQMGINPMVTAWELLPLSHVVDWFLNIGTIIQSMSALDLSIARQGCTSVKSHETTTMYLWDKSSDLSQFSLGATACHPAESGSYTFTRDIDAVIRRNTTQKYVRFLWSLSPPPDIQFNANLNWKRAIDAAVILLNPATRILRSL